MFQPGFEAADTSVTVAVGLYRYYGPYYNHPSAGQLPSSPLRYDATGAPPFFVAHGDHDTWTPVALAQALVRHLR